MPKFEQPPALQEPPSIESVSNKHKGEDAERLKKKEDDLKLDRFAHIQRADLDKISIPYGLKKISLPDGSVAVYDQAMYEVYDKRDVKPIKKHSATPPIPEDEEGLVMQGWSPFNFDAPSQDRVWFRSKQNYV